jgi:hypothetical protein
MTRTLFAAMSGVAFGLVLGVSVYHFYGQLRGDSAPPQVVHIVQAPPAYAVIGYVTVASPASEPADETRPLTAAEIDAQADSGLAQARALAKKDPAKARALCRQVMQLYHNDPKNCRVRTAFKLLNTIRIPDDGDED